MSNVLCQPASNVLHYLVLVIFYYVSLGSDPQCDCDCSWVAFGVRHLDVTAPLLDCRCMYEFMCVSAPQWPIDLCMLD